MHATRAQISATQKRATRKRERTLRFVQAAHEALGESGLRAFTIEAVLAKVGLARRGFYECFESKDDLLLAVFAQSIAQGAVYFASVVEAAPSRSAALENFVHALIANSFDDEPSGNANRTIAFSHEHHKLAMSRPRELEAALEPLLSLISLVIADGVESGEFAPGEPRAFARFIYNMISSTVHAALLNPDGKPSPSELGRLADNLSSFCIAAVTSNKVKAE